jgi:hypothetical protein
MTAECLLMNSYTPYRLPVAPFHLLSSVKLGSDFTPITTTTMFLPTFGPALPTYTPNLDTILASAQHFIISKKKPKTVSLTGYNGRPDLEKLGNQFKTNYSTNVAPHCNGTLLIFE